MHFSTLTNGTNDVHDGKQRAETLYAESLSIIGIKMAALLMNAGLSLPRSDI